jgi:hypothetical protein
MDEAERNWAMNGNGDGNADAKGIVRGCVGAPSKPLRGWKQENQILPEIQ